MIRRAAKAGSWYEANGEILSKQLDEWLSQVPLNQSIPAARAIIAPHAGFSYSGPTAAFSYKYINIENITTLFLLGPSHFASFDCGGLTEATYFETPCGNITIDTDIIQKLHQTGSFIKISKQIDEKEHSLEMHLPYIVKCITSRNPAIKLVPIMVGSLSKANQNLMGKILSPYLDDPQNLFIVSSDFCHWGDRFSYTRYDSKHGPIFKSIEALDRKGMEAISTQDPENFRTYLSATRNTICGRIPILVFLEAIHQSQVRHSLEFVHYTQSSQVKDLDDSSVSYAAGVLSRLPS